MIMMILYIIIEWSYVCAVIVMVVEHSIGSYSAWTKNISEYDYKIKKELDCDAANDYCYYGKDGGNKHSLSLIIFTL